MGNKLSVKRVRKLHRSPHKFGIEKDKLLKMQEPLPDDFQKVLDDNRWDLYEWEGKP